VLLFFSVARSQEIGSWERANEVAQNSEINAGKASTAAKPSKNGSNPAFGTNMPLMSSAFDTACWLAAA
jgi:hypothetical protein